MKRNYVVPTIPTAANAAAPVEPGRVYTSGDSFRARAEAHARSFRVSELQVPAGEYGHVLNDAAAASGKNFIHPSAFTAIRSRAASGKGVHVGRSFGNMLASQALCFNIFAPLASSNRGLGLASEVLRPFVRELATVRSIKIEHTPAFEVF